MRKNAEADDSWSSSTCGGGGGDENNIDESSSEAGRVKACIAKEIRQFEVDKNVVNNLGKEEIRLRLKYLDSQMELDIEALRVKYEKKRNTILEVIEMKKNNAQIY